MVDIPLDRLLQIAMDDLHKNQAGVRPRGQADRPNKTPQQVLDELRIYPRAGPTAQYVPSDLRLTDLVYPHQPHHYHSQRCAAHAGGHAALYARDDLCVHGPAGAVQTHSTKAYFNVTLPEKDWTPEHIAGHMAQFNVGTIVSTSVHEAYPGHYVQFLWTPQFGSKIRKLLGANTNIEGWAHYCEQMMLDQGYAAAPAGASAGAGATGSSSAWGS